MKARKPLMMMSSIALSVAMLAGCGTSSGGAGNAAAGQDAAPAPAPKDDNKPVTIQYWHSHGESQIPGMNKIIEAFEKKYPNIKVEPVFQGAYPDLAKKLIAAQAANAVPALTVAENSVMPSLAYNGLLADLGPYIKRDKMDLTDFSKGELTAYAYDGVQYGIPFLVSMNAIVYNKTMFDQAGIKAPETWDEMKNLAKVVKKEGDKFTRYGFAINYSQLWDIEPWLTNGGGSLFKPGATKGTLQSNLDSPESIRVIKQFSDWQKEGILYPVQGTGAVDTATQMFLNGDVGMWQTTSSSLTGFTQKAKFEIGSLFIPGDKTRVAEIGGASLVIMDKAPQDQKEAAWKFIQFATAAETNIDFVSALGYLPTSRKAIASPEGQKFFEKFPYLKNLFDHFDDVVTRPQTPAFAATKAPSTSIFDRIVVNNMDPEQSLKQGAQEVNKVLKDFK